MNGNIWDKAWSEYGEEAGNLLIKYQPLYRKVVRGYSRNEAHFEEMYDDVVTYRLPRFLEMWDPTVIPSVNTWLVMQIRFYCMKFNNKEQLRYRRERNGVAPTSLERPMTHNFKEFSIDLEDVHITEDEARLLHFRFAQEFSYREIGDWLGVTPYEARKRCKAVLTRVKEHFGVRP